MFLKYHQNGVEGKINGIEIKTILEIRIVIAEEEYQRKIIRKQCKRIFHNFAHNFLSHLSERYQVLHHTYAQNDLLAVNQYSHIIQSTVINYNQDLFTVCGLVFF